MNGDSIRQTLAQNIKRFRETRKISQADLAFDAGISIPFLSDIERGNKWPSPETIEKLSSALNIEPFQLFYPDTKLNEKNRLIIEKIINELSVAQNTAIKKICEKYL